jgi:ABC-type antimicrobial peptide transport system permease subunit
MSFLAACSNESDLENDSPVVVVGTDIVDNLMPGVDPIGKEIRIDGWIYRIIGVGKKKGSTLGQSLDNYVFMPMTSWFKQYGVYNIEHANLGQSCWNGPRCSTKPWTKLA